MASFLLALRLAMAALVPLAVYGLRLPSSPLVVAHLASSVTCSSFQQQTIVQLYDSAASTAACAPYAVTTSSYSYISSPCSASACITVAQELAAQLPDCVTDGVNEKTQLLEALEACSSSSSSSSSPSSPSSSSTAGDVGDECTSAQLVNMTDEYLAAAETSACSSYMSSVSIDIYAPCGATACLAVIEDLAAAIPSCWYEGANFKQQLEDSLEGCGVTSGGSQAYTDIPVTARSSSSQSDSDECSTSELDDLSYLYLSAAAAAVCSAYATVTSTYVDISPPCTATACLYELVEVARQMPNCSVDGVNYKESLSEGLEDCGVSLDGSSTGSTGGSSLTNTDSAASASASTSASSDAASGGLKPSAWALATSVLALALAH